jgi:hypothetical protein
MLLRYLRLSAAAVGLFLLAPAPANAKSYLVMSCTNPLGQPNAAVGWTQTSAPGGLTANSCDTADGALTATLVDANPPPTSSASWRFDAPTGTRIVRITGTRNTTGVSPSSSPADSRYQFTADDQVLEDCQPGQSSSCVANLAGPLDKQGLNAAFVEFRVFCANGDRACTQPLGIRATQMWPTLEDAASPVVSNPQMIDDGDRSRTLRVRYDAADVGGGVYRTIVKVDGTLAQVTPLGPASCVDANPNDDDPFQFTVPVPCLASITGAEAVVEASKLAPGPHGIEVAVQDAAGNETPVFGPVLFPRANGVTGVTGASSTPAQLANIRNATLKMWFVKARHHGRRFTSKFGTRVVTRGVLQSRDGRGIRGARVDVYHILKSGKRRRLLKTGLKSRAGGELTLILPLNVDSRTIEFAYRALRPGPITSRQRLHLTVLRKGKIYRRR